MLDNSTIERIAAQQNQALWTKAAMEAYTEGAYRQAIIYQQYSANAYQRSIQNDHA